MPLDGQFCWLLELSEWIDLDRKAIMAVKVLYSRHILLRLEALMQTLFNDLRYALRQLLKSPGLSLLAIVTLALGVGANTAIFTFAGLAVAMVFAGLYGVLSQLVSYRRREIGVRMALGATRVNIARLVLRQGSILVGCGLGVGLALAFAMGRLIRSFLYQVQPSDMWTYAGVVFALAVIGLTASLLPARKAASIQPMQALRED
jgi:predicted lysophospholipase L1 biosynthesis ABC-type transport system permease subunit